MKIVLTRRSGVTGTVTIDDSDWSLVMGYTWHLTAGGYACTNRKVGGRYVSCMMHRLILGVEGSQTWDVDHVNRNKLDNRRSNLRVCSHLENTQNRSLHCKNKTGVRGVICRPNGRYEVRLMVAGKRLHLGMRDSLEDALALRTKGEIQHYKEFAPGVSRG